MGRAAVEDVVEEINFIADRFESSVRHLDVFALLGFYLGHDAFFAVADGNLRGSSRFEFEAAEIEHAAQHVMNAGGNRYLLIADDRVPYQVALTVKRFARRGIEGDGRFAPAAPFPPGGQGGDGAQILVDIADGLHIDLV